MKIHILILSALALILFMLTSCSIFDTREPEEPDDGAGSTYIQPEQASNVIQNLQSAIAEMNQTNYMRNFSDIIFEYRPSSNVSDSGIWENWGLSDEEDYFSGMASSVGDRTGHQLQFENEELSETSAGERFSAEYILTVNHSADLPTEANGEIILELERGEDGLWEITEWNDFGSGSDFTWSDFRAAFLQ